MKPKNDQNTPKSKKLPKYPRKPKYSNGWIKTYPNYVGNGWVNGYG